jgi:hypothetical protein
MADAVARAHRADGNVTRPRAPTISPCTTATNWRSHSLLRQFQRNACAAVSERDSSTSPVASASSKLIGNSVP